MLNKRNITIVISLLLFYLLGSMVVNSVFLADDLAWHGVSFSEIINHFNFTTRPLSAIPMGILMELMHYSDYYYYLAYIFVIISVYLVYKTLMLYVENELFAYLGTLLYIILPIGTSSFYSMIMLNSNMAIGFYCLSLIYLKKDYNRRNLLISSLFFLSSILSYEICIPLLLLNILLIQKNKFKSSREYKHYIVMLVLTPVVFYFFYRFALRDLLFVNSTNRERIGKIFNVSRDFQVIYKLILIYPFSLIKSIVRGVIAIRFYSIEDFVVLIMVNILFVLQVAKYKFREIKNLDKVLKLSIIGFVLTNGIYFLSDYLPNLYYFSNRVMGASKLLFGVVLVAGVFYISKKSPNVAKGTLFLGFFLLSVTAISIKNAWIYANEFNISLFKKTKSLIKTLPSKDQNIARLAIDYNIHKILSEDQHFILREPIYNNTWGTSFLCKVSGFQYINRGGQYSGSRVFIDKDVKEIPQYDDEYFINLKKYPYYYVKPLEGKIYVVRNEKDFFNAIKK